MSAAGTVAVVPPEEHSEGDGLWVPLGWTDRAGLGLWVRHRPASVELSSNEVVFTAGAPEGVEPAGEMRVFLYARADTAEPESARSLREQVGVVVAVGAQRLRLDLASAETLATALDMVTGRAAVT